MILNRASNDELLSFCSKLTTTIDEAIFIVNRQYKVVFSNPSFQNLVQKEELFTFGFDFGDALGCRYLTKGTKVCGKNYYCELCIIRNTINDCFEEDKISQVKDFVRDFELRDETIFRHIHFKAYPIDIDKEKYVALVVVKSDS